MRIGRFEIWFMGFRYNYYCYTHYSRWGCHQWEIYGLGIGIHGRNCGHTYYV